MARSNSRTLLALTIPVGFVTAFWLLRKRASRFGHLKEDSPENISSQLLYSMNIKGTDISVNDSLDIIEMPIPQSQGDTLNQSCIPVLNGLKKEVSENASIPSMKSEGSSVDLLNGKKSLAENKFPQKCTDRVVAKDQSENAHQPLLVNGLVKNSVCDELATKTLPTPADEVITPVRDEVTSPATDEVTSPATDEVTSPATDEVTSPATDEVTSPATDEVTSPATDEVTSPAADEVTTPAADEVTTPAADEVTTPAADEVTTPAADEVTTPSVNGIVADTNGHRKPVDITNSIFSRLSSFRIFVPTRHMTHDNANTEEQCIAVENRTVAETRDSNENSTVAETQDGASNASEHMTQVLENLELLSVDLPSGDIDHSVAGMSGTMGYQIPSTSGHYPPVCYGMPTNSHMMSAAAYTMPIDYMLTNRNPYRVEYAVNPSPEPTYCDSLVSDDSGRGPSESPNEAPDPDSGNPICMVYEFEILPKDCGLMIGLNGRHVKYLYTRTGAKVIIKKHPYNYEKKICSVTGTESQIQDALRLIRKKFPESEFPHMTLEQLNHIHPSLICPDSLKLHLPERVSFDAILSSTVTAGHFFLQQPTHPTYYQLFSMRASMKAMYSHNSPILENPVPGNICVAVLQNDWYRAEVMQVLPDAQACTLKFLDFGGYADVPMLNIRQIKYEYMTIPFQATECLLAGVESVDESWSEDAKTFFEVMAQGHVLRGIIAGYAGIIPCVHLFRNNGPSSIYINQSLVNQGYARPISEE